MSLTEIQQGLQPVGDDLADVPVGYKRNDIGIIPRNWSVEAISSIADVKTGPFGSALHERDYVDDGTPIITVEHLSEQGITHYNLPLVSDEDRSRLKSYRLRAGDIVFSRVGSVDRNSLVSAEEDGWLFSGRLLRIRTSDNTAYPPYLSYHFHSEPFKRRVRGVAVGQTMASLNTQILKAVYVVLPPTPEQRAIAEALSDVDELLGALEALIAKKRAIKQATMQQLLTGKTRLPGFTGEWVTKQVSEFGEIITGATPRTDIVAFWGELYPWITPTDISSDRDMVVSERMITQEGLNSIRMIPANSVLVTCIASIGKNAILKTKGGCNQQINAVIPSAFYSAEFLYYLFEFNSKCLLANAGITATRIVSKATFSGLAFKVPQLDEQTAIAVTLSDMDAEIAALERRRDKTRAIKQGMMQQLLTGRVRLVQPEKDAEQTAGP